jgi:hypothetical protein
VSTLVSEQVSAGRHEVVFNGENISSQILFCQLNAKSKYDNYISTKKMILLK